MTQTITKRYDVLLEERFVTGRRYIDAVCHGAPFEVAEELHLRLEALDKRLDRFNRYRQDYRRVMAAEDARWHHPQWGPPTGPSCAHCLRGDMTAFEGLEVAA